MLISARTSLPKADTFAGTIAFLPAHPNADPGLELDVVTPHHTKYYESKDPNAVATDTEDPIPVFFPAVKPQGNDDHFTFPLIPLRLGLEADLTHAKTWLGHGLEIFGLGAKTAAGYGWFDASETSENLTYPFNPKYKHHKDLHFEKADPKIIANFKWFSVTYRNNRNSHCDSGV